MTAGPRAELEPVLVVLGVLSADEEQAGAAVSAFGDTFGGVALFGPAVPFDSTRYYEAEMGPGLARRFYAFQEMANPDRLVDLKLAAWKLEQDLALDGRRRVNLDPGYVDVAKVVLASFKPAPHKLYLGQAVWADTVLFYRDGALRPLPWTFPDLREGPHVDFFGQARRHHRALLRAWRRAGEPAQELDTPDAQIQSLE